MFHLHLIAFIGHTLFLLRKQKKWIAGMCLLFSSKTAVSIGSWDAEFACEDV
jgi:hypothetical protein